MLILVLSPYLKRGIILATLRHFGNVDVFKQLLMRSEISEQSDILYFLKMKFEKQKLRKEVEESRENDEFYVF